MPGKDYSRWVEVEAGVFIRSLPAPATGEEGIKATAAAVELAATLGVDLTQVKGTGKGGQITKPDVEAAGG